MAAMHEQQSSETRNSTNSGTPRAVQPSTLVLMGVVVLVCFVLFRGGLRPVAQIPVASEPVVATGQAGRSSPQQSEPLRWLATKSAAATAGEAKIRQALENKVDLEYSGRPLDQSLEDVARQLAIPLKFDTETLVDEGVALDQPVTLHLHGITGRSALRLLLAPIQLDWLIADEVLIVTTADYVIRKSLETRVYDVADLVTVQSDKAAMATDLGSLVDLVTATIAPESWEDLQGSGSVRKLQSGGVHALVIIQTPMVHDLIALLLAELRSRRHPDIATILPGPAHQESRPRPKRSSAWAGPFVNSRADAVVRGNNLLAIDLYKQLASENDGNVLVSPISLTYCMALLYTGARGDTAAEIGSAMHFLVPQNDLLNAIGLLWPPVMMGGMPGPGNPWWMVTAGRGGQMHVLNFLWLQNGIKAHDAFSEGTSGRAPEEWLRHTDFSNAIETERNINEIVSQSTGKTIPKIVTTDNFADATRCLVTNANTFNGAWARPFSPRATAPSTFETGESRVDVAMLHMETDFCRYAASEGFEILKKPYADDDVSLVILLPARRPGSLAELETNLSEVNLVRWLAMGGSEYHTEFPEVFLPKFKLESGFPLRKAFEALGMKKAFQAAEADFSGLFEPGNLKLDDVFHRSVVEVDEGILRGSTAAHVRRHAGEKMPDQRPVFRADHPFIFLIRDNRTGCILFIGRLVDPSC
jgi:serpin B